MKKTMSTRVFLFVTILFVMLCAYFTWQIADELSSLRRTQPSELAAEEKEKSTQTDKAEVTKMQLPYEYMLVVEEGYLTVYKKDLQTVYMYTDIRFEELPAELQQQMLEGKPFADLEKLYDFLENYSS